MLDWIELLNDLIYGVQWLTTLVILGLIGIACLAFFISKKTAINCGILALFLIIIATVFEQFGIQLLAPEVFAFFQNLFK